MLFVDQAPIPPLPFMGGFLWVGTSVAVTLVLVSGRTHFCFINFTFMIARTDYQSHSPCKHPIDAVNNLEHSKQCFCLCISIFQVKLALLFTRTEAVCDACTL